MPKREIEGDWLLGWPDRKRPAIIPGKDAEGRVINGRSPVTELGGLMTPTEAYFIVNHLVTPDPVYPGDWKLAVKGEVERAFEGLPGIKACAAIGVPSPLADQDILLYVEPAGGAVPDLGKIAEHARRRLAPFMVPRYVKIVASLPRTPTEKVAKSSLPRTIDGSLTLPEPGSST